MAIFKNNRGPGHVERAELEQASQRNRAGEFQEELLERTGDEKFAKTYRTRGRLYDKIKVSLRTMDIIIYGIVAAIVVALVLGIAVGN